MQWCTYCYLNKYPHQNPCNWKYVQTEEKHIYESDHIEVVDYDTIKCQHCTISLLHERQYVTVCYPDVLTKSPIVTLVIKPEKNVNYKNTKFCVKKCNHISENLVIDVFDNLFTNFNVQLATTNMIKSYVNNIIKFLKTNKQFNYNKEILTEQAKSICISRYYIRTTLCPFYQQYLFENIDDLFNLISAFPNQEWNIDCTFQIFNNLNHYDPLNQEYLKLKMSLGLVTGVFGLIRNYYKFEAASETNENYAKLVAPAFLRCLYYSPIAINLKLTYVGTDNCENQVNFHKYLIAECKVINQSNIFYAKNNDQYNLDEIIAQNQDSDEISVQNQEQYNLGEIRVPYNKPKEFEEINNNKNNGKYDLDEISGEVI